MRFEKALLGLALGCVACIPVCAGADDANYLSMVNFRADDGAANGDVDGQAGIIGEVGKPMQFHIVYQVGWYNPPPGGAGTMVLKESSIEQPEYEALWDDNTHNSPDYPTGLSFDKSAGVFSGTPTQAGTWKYAPSVRDRENGEKPYRGDGFWWTEYDTYNGKTWIVAKDETVVIILPPPSSKAVMLQCSGSSNTNLLLQVDYDTSLVRVFGNDGKLAGVYHANVTDDFIGWGKMSSTVLYATSMRLDRKQGTFTTTADNGNPTPPSGSCSKRSTEQKF